MAPTAPLPEHDAGRPLASAQRRRLERAFATDLSAVRVHSGPQAQRTAAGVNARAFASGSHIYLGSGQSADDVRLVAHEAAHTVQQSAEQNAAYPNGPPHSASHLNFSTAPAGMIQRQEAEADREESWAEQGFWWAVERLAPQWLVDLLHEIRHIGFWEFLKRRLTGALNGIFSFLEGRGGITAQLAGLFRRLLDRGRVILGALVAGNCEPLFAAVREFRDVLSQMAGEAWDRITEFFRPIGEYLSGLWQKFGAPVVDFLREMASDVWDSISGLGRQLWDALRPVRDFYSGAWTALKELLGFGEGGSDDDGSGGVTAWISEQLGRVWNEVKGVLEPVIAPIRSVVQKIQSILPLNAILNLRDTITQWMDSAMQMADTMEEEGDIAENQELIRDIILPGIRRAIQNVRGRLTSAQTWVTGVIGEFVGSTIEFFGTLQGNSLLRPLSGTIQWLADEARSLGEWAVDTVGGLFSLADRALTALNTWIEPILRGLQRLIQALSNLMERLGDFILGPFMLIPRCIRDPIKNFLIEQILSRIPVFSQLLALPDLWTRAQTVFRRIVVQIFRDGNLFGAAWTFFREVIQLFGLPPQLVTNLIRNAARAIGDILRDPFGFLGNLLRSIRDGFLQFMDNIGTHLLEGLANWLFGTLGEAGIRIPREFSLRAVFDVVLQILDITQERIFAAIERRVGPERTAQIRRGLGIAMEIFNLVRILVEQGPAGLWEEIRSRLSNLWDMVIEGVRDFVIGRIIAFATRWIVSLLDISGITPIINSLVAIYNAIESFFRYLRQMLEILNSVFEGLGEIARGILTRAANLVETNLARVLPIAIGFLANQVGLGNLPVHLRRIIEGIRTRVDRALDWIVDRIVRGIQAVVSAVRSGAAAVRSGIEAALDWLGLRRSFRNASGETHELYFRGQADTAEIIIESTPRPLVAYLADYEANKNPTADERAAIAQIRARVTEIENIKSARGTRGRGSFTQADGESIQAKYEAILVLLQRLRGEGTAPPPTQIIERATMSGSGDGTKMVAHPLSINPGGLAGGQPFGESVLWRAVSRRKRRAGGNTFYVRGHLLNHHLHGAGSIENMVPITGTANGQMERFAESQVKGAVLNQNKVVRYEVEVTGANTGRTRIPEESQLPTHIRMLAKELRQQNGAWVDSGTVVAQTTVENNLPADNEGVIEVAA